MYVEYINTRVPWNRINSDSSMARSRSPMLRLSIDMHGRSNKSKKKAPGSICFWSNRLDGISFFFFVMFNGPCFSFFFYVTNPPRVIRIHTTSFLLFDEYQMCPHFRAVARRSNKKKKIEASRKNWFLLLFVCYCINRKNSKVFWGR